MNVPARAFTALGSAMYGALDAATTLNVYQGIAPQGGTPPYVIFNQQAARDEYTFNSRFVSARYQVRVVSIKQWPSEAQAAYDALHQTLQDYGMTITGYTLLRLRRESTIGYMDPGGYWHVGGIYRVDIQEV